MSVPVRRKLIFALSSSFIKLTWRVRVSLKARIKYLKCVRCERGSSFSFLWRLNTHEIRQWTLAHLKSTVKDIKVQEKLNGKFGWTNLPSFRLLHPLLENGLNFLGTFRSNVEFFEPEKTKTCFHFFQNNTFHCRVKNIKDSSNVPSWMPGHFFKKTISLHTFSEQPFCNSYFPEEVNSTHFYFLQCPGHSFSKLFFYLVLRFPLA